MSFIYCLNAFVSDFNPAVALGLVAELQSPVRSHDIREDAPPTRSFVRVETGGTVVTALKPAENDLGAVVRFWNPGTKNAEARFQLDRPVTGACLCNLNEEALEPLGVTSEGEVKVPVPAGGLATVRFTW